MTTKINFVVFVNCRVYLEKISNHVSKPMPISRNVEKISSLHGASSPFKLKYRNDNLIVFYINII